MTNEEIKEFWEWCGFTILKEKEWDLRRRARIGFIYPNGGRYTRLPSLGLNNLFRWAVPKLQEISKEHYITFEHPFNDPTTWAITINIELHYNYKEFEGRDKDPAIALFRAIQQVIKEGV